MRGGFVILIVVTIVAFILDAITNKCIQSSVQGATITLLHHLIYVFSLLGWLLDDPAILILYVTLPAIVTLHWKTSKECFVDEVTGELCGGHKQFNHLGHRLGIPNSIMGSIVCIGVIVALWKLWMIFTGRRRVGPGKDSIPSPFCMAKGCKKGSNNGAPACRAR